jgi:hypothetical protein
VEKVMKIFIVAMTIALLTVPAYPQTGGINGAQSAGRAGRAGAPEEPKVDPAKQKADDKAFKDAVNRIPAPEKKYDPWGTVRQNGK